MTFYLVDKIHHNYSDDSYEYGVFFNPETKEVQKELIWTTAFGLTPKNDLNKPTDEIMNLYLRVCRVRNWIEDRKRFSELAKKMGLSSYHAAKKLRFSLTENEFDSIYNLLKTKKFRSDFRKSLCNQVRSWAESEENEYSTPLSKKQIQYI